MRSADKSVLRLCTITARGAQFDALDRMVLLKDCRAPCNGITGLRDRMTVIRGRTVPATTAEWLLPHNVIVLKAVLFALATGCEVNGGQYPSWATPLTPENIQPDAGAWECCEVAVLGFQGPPGLHNWNTLE